jgi:hypothetical protein
LTLAVSADELERSRPPQEMPLRPSGPTQSIKQFISKRTVWANGPKAEAVLINGHTFEGVELPAIVCARATAAIAGPLGRSNLTLTLAA